MSVPLPDDVRRFLLVVIPSVPHLESLLLLHDEPGTSWTPAMLAGRIYVTPELAGQLLLDLESCGLAESSDDVFRYFPVEPATAHVVEQLAGLYARNVVDVARLIHSKSDLAAQRFADAFRLRRET